MPRRTTPQPTPSTAATRRAPARVRRTLAALAALATTVTLGACDSGPSDKDPDHVDIVAAFYPLEYVAKRVGGDAAMVTTLTKPGVEPHEMELSPKQVGQVNDAEVVIYLKGFQPAVDDAVEQQAGDRALDVAGTVPLLPANSAVHRHDGDSGQAGSGQAKGAKDPHVWLDPSRLATIADAVAARLSKVNPDEATSFTARADALRADLEKLDEEYKAGLKTCQRRELVVSHTAFGYLADRYDLEQIGLSGLTPDQEPSPKRLEEVTKEARAHKATTIFFETLVSPKVADTIAEEVEAKTAVLDPLEGLQPDSAADYLSVMRKNLATIRPALGCS